MITSVPGVAVGHWSDQVARTGCTVVRFPEGTVASGEVRGGAPATREFALLDPSCTVQTIDALVLSGGSAFGLAAADGVTGALAAEGVGFATSAGNVPIVVGLCLFDLAVGDGTVRPGAAEGRAALAGAGSGPVELGLVGAGTGATVAKWRDAGDRRPGGLVGASMTGEDGLVVAALVAVNAFGEPGADPAVVARQLPLGREDAWSDDAGENTTIGVVVTNARLDKQGCQLVARSAHDGLARSVAPSHTQADGDAFVAAATGQLAASLARVRAMTVATVSEAVLGLSLPVGEH